MKKRLYFGTIDDYALQWGNYEDFIYDKEEDLYYIEVEESLYYDADFINDFDNLE